MKQKFEDIPWGTHFTDGRRKFIKLQTHSASGHPFEHRWDGVPFNGGYSFNAVDYDGAHATCPDLCLFEVIEKPS